MPSSSRSIAAGAGALWLSSALSLQIASAQTAAAPAAGELWEVTSQMTMAGMEGMPGMAIPAQKNRVCSPRDSKEPPGAASGPGECQQSDVQVSGAKTTWKMRCSGPPAMSGTGEITRNGPDAYTGNIRFDSAEGGMTMKLSGRRVGPCTLGAR